MARLKPHFALVGLWAVWFIGRHTSSRRSTKELTWHIPDVRADKVEKIRAAVKTGSYHVRSEQVADKIIEHTLLDATLTAHAADGLVGRTMSRKRGQQPISKFYTLIEFLRLGLTQPSGHIHSTAVSSKK